MTRTILLSAATYDLLRSCTTPGYNFLDIATRRTDGSYDCPVDDELHDRLLRIQMKGESMDDVVTRVVHLYKSGNRKQ